MLGDCGPIDQIDIIRDLDTNESKGFGFVKFAAAKHAQDAIEKFNGFNLQNRPLTVSLARRGRPRAKTPGKYLGKTKSFRDRSDSWNRERRRRSPYYRGRDRPHYDDWDRPRYRERRDRSRSPP